MRQQPYASQSNMTTRAAQFDECVAELSPEAQYYFFYAIKKIADNMADGGGEKSAKELLFQIAKVKSSNYQE